MSKQKHYINNGDFLKALIEYKEKCKLVWEKRRAKKLAEHTGGIR